MALPLGRGFLGVALSSVLVGVYLPSAVVALNTRSRLDSRELPEPVPELGELAGAAVSGTNAKLWDSFVRRLNFAGEDSHAMFVQAMELQERMPLADLVKPLQELPGGGRASDAEVLTALSTRALEIEVARSKDSDAWWAGGDVQPQALVSKIPIPGCRFIAALTNTTINIGFYNQQSNVGDFINPDLVSALSSGREIHECTNPNVNKYIVVGSIIQTHSDRHSIIWGAGVIGSGHNLRAGRLPKQIYAVRGPHTRQELLINGAKYVPEVYGDPAILFPEVFDPRNNVKKEYDICVIPHLVDKDAAWIEKGHFTWQLSLSLKSRLIDIQLSPREFVKQLVSCKFVASSTLHGMILSDAYGIPNKWIKLSEEVHGHGFKFRDYFDGIDRKDAGTRPFEVDVYTTLSAVYNLRPNDYHLDLKPAQRKLRAACPFCNVPYGEPGSETIGGAVVRLPESRRL